MKISKLVLTLITLLWYNIQAQDVQQMVSKCKYKLYEEKKLRPVNTVKMELEITTADGKFPATLWLMDNMVYKLEMKEHKGASFEFIDQNSYKLLSANGKLKEQALANTETHFRKKIWLNFYPFLNLRDEFPTKEIQSEADMGGGVSVSIAVIGAEPPQAVPQNPGEKIYMQMLGFGDIRHVFYFNMLTMNINKINTLYYVNGEEKKDEVLYKKIVQSPEGYYYPSEFTTTFGAASVKSIQFNKLIKPEELEPNF
jgi:hypothetical protein